MCTDKKLTMVQILTSAGDNYWTGVEAVSLHEQVAIEMLTLEELHARISERQSHEKCVSIGNCYEYSVHILRVRDGN